MPGPLDLLVPPERALAFPGSAGQVTWPEEVLAAAQRYHAEHDWPMLAELYQRLADIAWNQEYRAASIRLLLAERCLAERIGDQRRLSECTYFLAARHRLQDHFLPAEAWAREVLRSPPAVESATMHIAAWRELAAIREVSSDYDQGLEFCDEAASLYQRYAGARGMASVTSVPSSTRPSTTPTLTPASLAASDFPCSRPSDNSSINRRRAGVMRCGALPTSRTPTRTRSGPRCSPIRSVIRSTMPRADSV